MFDHLCTLGLIDLMFVCLYVCVRVCVYVCVNVHSPWKLHLSGSIGVLGNRPAMLYWRGFLPMPSSHIILFTHSKWAKPRLNQCASRFQNIRTSSTIIKYRLRSAPHRKPVCYWRLHSREESQSNYERAKLLWHQYWIQSLAKYLRRYICSTCSARM